LYRKENERSVDNRETFGELFNTKTENKHADAMANGRVNINNKGKHTNYKKSEDCQDFPSDYLCGVLDLLRLYGYDSYIE
jgi:hypothetical protein